MDGESSRHNNMESLFQDSSLEPHIFLLVDLRKMTDNFSEERLLGQGGFGTVYKGLLENGGTLAVKKLALSINPEIQDRQFKNEVSYLMRFRHPNIVRLVGYCSDKETIIVYHEERFVSAEKPERLLCLEYMPNGSLREHLLVESSGLDWDTSYKIIEGICNGLHYLHEEQQGESIIHRDLKPENILLDHNMVPKIADFGLSKIFGEAKTRTLTKGCPGTLGYMAPEYITSGIITKKSDVFSLGVIIIEIMAGHKDYPYEIGTSSQEFVEMVSKKWRNRLREAHGRTSLEIDCQRVTKCIWIGLACAQHDSEKRPTICEIIEMLHGSAVIDGAVAVYRKIGRGLPTSSASWSTQPAITDDDEDIHTETRRGNVDPAKRRESTLAPADASASTPPSDGRMQNAAGQIGRRDYRRMQIVGSLIIFSACSFLAVSPSLALVSFFFLGFLFRYFQHLQNPSIAVLISVFFFAFLFRYFSHPQNLPK